MELGGPVPHGSLLVDQAGAIVSGVVIKDCLMLSEEGILTTILTIDKESGQLLTSPDIISLGAMYAYLRKELLNAVSIRRLNINTNIITSSAATAFL